MHQINPISFVCLILSTTSLTQLAALDFFIVAMKVFSIKTVKELILPSLLELCERPTLKKQVVIHILSKIVPALRKRIPLNQASMESLIIQRIFKMANKLQESHGNDETQETLSSMKASFNSVPLEEINFSNANKVELEQRHARREEYELKETERKRIEEEEIDLKALMQRLKLQKPGDGVGFGSSVKRNLITMPSSGKTPQAKIYILKKIYFVGYKRMATQRQSLFSVSSQHQAASLIPTSTRRDQKTQQNTPERRNSHNLQQTGASLLKAKTPSKKISMTPYQSNPVSLAPSNIGAGGAAVALSNGSGSGKHGAVTTQKSEGFTAAAHQHHLIRFPTSTISSGGSHLEKTQSAIGGPRLSKK